MKFAVGLIAKRVVSILEVEPPELVDFLRVFIRSLGLKGVSVLT